jgi:hypothetical protein
MNLPCSNSSRAAPGLSAIVLAVLFCGAGQAVAAGQNLQLVADGVPAANGAVPPATAAFEAWCTGGAQPCFPTTEFPVYDPGNGQPKGMAYVWGRDFAFGAGGALCFSEFIVFSLAEGELHIVSGTNGTCGAPMDPALKPPRAIPGADFVLAGGGDGTVAGGTGKYARWSGTFSDRVFVGFSSSGAGVGGIVYYDQLWFTINAR